MFKKQNCLKIAIMFMLLISLPSFSFSQETDKNYLTWSVLGMRAAYEAAVNTQHELGIDYAAIVLTNAGYAEIDGLSTEAALDGLQELTYASRGNNSLVEVHSKYDDALWFAIYYPTSGMCAYLEVNPLSVSKLFSSTDSPSFYQIITDNLAVSSSELFSIASFENINPEHLYANADEYNDKFGTQLVFGKNAFRIVTIANAVAKGAPKSLLRSVEFHDHYCPGVTSGILAVNYIKKNFPLTSGGSYFVQSVQPWCKEDALMTLLNATPGKGGYSVLYSTAEDREAWNEDVKDAATIIYRQDGETKKWDGIVIGISLGDTGCPDYGTGSIMSKLCSDLWHLDRLDQPESFVKVINQFELPEGVSPKDWARPGVDPMKQLGLVQE
ncbi:conserved exported hypothetical protein [Desulfamplus magnetovallimortis]|uniref:Formylmethanofuran dehydrogenase subunit E domain-containing protein n=1 Tax=Desulfamplus magnetovallimortis TaxID=1246637 RepID=A0A1W1HHB9_9BACT|nr:FmdE family protein [Desulfamplus magnetovallimortis]SLM31897.1 conserved exported hypothetical protein [Desulfamplus magnetovallimortis]